MIEIWSSLYGTMTTQRVEAVMFIVIYMLRRLAFSATAVFLKDYGLI